MKHFSIVLFMLGIMSSIFGTFIINRTITIDAVTLAAMRGSSVPASHLFDPYIDNLSESNSQFIHDDAASDITRAVPETVTKMNDAVNNNPYGLNDALFNESLNNQSINSILSCLSYVPTDTVAALGYFTNAGITDPDSLVTADRRALDLTYYTINAAMLYDCLYYAPSGNVPDSVKSKLRDILLACIHLTRDTIDSYDSLSQVQQTQWGINIPKTHHYPGFSIIQYRLQMFGAMGLAALLLRETVPSLYDEMNRHLNYINNILLDEPIPDAFPIDKQYQGMLAFHTTNSGAYFESLGYQGQLLQMLCPFFTAYKRLTSGAVNYYNNQYIVSWINDLTRKVTPTEADWPYNDDWGRKSINPSAVFFYYNNSNNQDVRSKCSWYVKSKPTLSFPTGYASYGHACRSYILVKYLSDPFLSPGISSITYIPSFISQGSSSNSEYSVLRKPINGDFATTLAEFRDVATMFVLHENSFSPYHGQSDHLSYSFYYKGMPFLIDPGYRVGTIPVASNPAFAEWNYSREWMRSIYAHNMVIVDPITDRELHELRNRYWSYNAQSDNLGISGTYRPFSAFNNYDDLLVNESDIVRDPCYRDYYQQSGNLDLLRTRVVYNDFLTNLPIAEIKRSFLRYGGLFLVFDDIDSFDDEPHEYSSLYQFGIFDPDVSSVNTTANGFAIQKGSPSSGELVDIICGSTGIYVNQLDNTATGFDQWHFPTSYKLSSSPDSPNYTNIFGHARGRTKVIEAGDTSIMAILVPQDASNPVVVQNTVYEPFGYYGAELTQNTRSIPTLPVSRFFGCTDGSQQSLSFGANEISTNGKLFAASILSNVQPYLMNQSIVLLEGDNISYNGTDLYRSYSGNERGMTATYAESSLALVLHEVSVSHPRLKIYRSGISPDNFTAIMQTVIPPVIPEPIPNPDPNYRFSSTDIIQSLAYDDQYFYVNYAWADLEAAGLISDDLVIAKGTIPQTELNTDLNIQGDIEITGNVTIAGGASMDIGPNSSVLISEGVRIHNYGLLTIDGGDSRSIIMDTSGQQWSGIVTYQNAYLFCNNAIIESAMTGIQVRGTATITNSEIRNCDEGISIDTSTPFIIENNRILQNSSGIVVLNNYIASSLGYISDNEITQNDVAVLIYNSNTMISNNDIHDNASIGLFMLRSSEPIVRECNISYTEINGISGPEIWLLNDSYPILDDNYNDINSDGIGYSLYYQSYGGLEPLKATNNYWGTTDRHQIQASIYPLSWRVDFVPFCLEPNTFFMHSGDKLFQQALVAEESGDQVLARQLYTSIVTNEPDSLYALQSLGRLNSIYAGYPDLINDLRGIYDAYMVACSDSVLIKGAQGKYAILERLDGLYPEAIQVYEDLLLFSTTEVDSLMCLLDISYTMQDMYYDDSGKAAHSEASYQSNGISISNLKDAKQTVEQLWGKILENSEDESIYNAPVPTKLEVNNYPNPFNPSTTITFSLPEESKVRLSIYNIRGQKVRDLIDGNMMRGFHKVIWDGKDNGNRSVSSGLYFIRIDSGINSVVKKVMMLK